MTTASFSPLGAGAAVAAGARLAKAFELWKFDSLADSAGTHAAHSSHSSQAGPTGQTPPPPTPAVVLNQLRENAKAEGYQAGLLAGRAEGRRLAAEESERFKALLHSATEAVNQLQDEVAAATLTLAFDIARQVLRSELRTQPDAVLPAVREALDLAGGAPAAPAQLLVCPHDAGVIREHLHDILDSGQWRLAEDPALGAGSCRVVTGNGTIDATLATRWQRVAEALGRQDVW